MEKTIPAANFRSSYGSIAGSDRRAATLILLASAALIFLAVSGSAGFFNIDEVIYFMGADAFRSTGSFVVDNGQADIRADELRLWLLIDGPAGLVPQYPPGSAIAGAPLLALFGQKGLVVLNVIAAIGTLILTHSLARRLFGSSDVALLAVGILAFSTFWIEYTAAIWPHSVSIFFTTLALRVFLGAIEAESFAWRPAVLSGLAVGTGILFRLEGVLIISGFAAATVLFARRPVQVIAGGAAGILPLFGLLGWLNSQKFGTWSPLTYGMSGGGTDLSTYLGLGAIMFLAIVALLGLRVLRSRLSALGDSTPIVPILLSIATLAAAGAAILSPSVARILDGTYSLLVDATTIRDPRAGVVAQPDGTLSFWGLPKKALGQSLPWLGCLALLIGAFPSERRRSVTIVLLVCGLWLLPFAMQSWHGGLGSNMRYFLPLLPPLCALAALLIVRLSGELPAGRGVLGFGIALGLICTAFWMLLLPERIFQMHQVISTYAFFGIVGICLVAGMVQRAAAASAALFAIGVGLGMAFVFGMSDLANGQERRAHMAQQSAAAASIEGPVVLLGPPEAFASAIGNREQVLALPDQVTHRLDASFIERVCAAGYRLVAAVNPGGVGQNWRSIDGAGNTSLAEYDCTVGFVR
jgi:hypothetical protein